LQDGVADGKDEQECHVTDQERNEVLHTIDNHLNKEAISLEYSDEEHELEDCQDDVQQFELGKVQHLMIKTFKSQNEQDAKYNKLKKVNHVPAIEVLNPLPLKLNHLDDQQNSGWKACNLEHLVFGL